MKNGLAVIGPIMFLVAGCGAAGSPEDTESLRREVAELKQGNADLRVKSEILSGLVIPSPPENFFAGPEFWDARYDPGQRECIRRCGFALRQAQRRCQAAEPNQRDECYRNTRAGAAACVQGCSPSPSSPR